MQLTGVDDPPLKRQRFPRAAYHCAVLLCSSERAKGLLRSRDERRENMLTEET